MTLSWLRGFSRDLLNCRLSYLLPLVGLLASCNGAESNERILYVTCVSDRICEFVSVASDGSDRSTILTIPSDDGPPLIPQCSPDHKEILFFVAAAERPSVFKASIETGEIEELTPNVSAVDPFWSPEGTRIVYSVIDTTGTPSLWTMNRDGVEPQPLGADALPALVSAWSPDGAIIAYTNPAAEAGVADIWLINADGSDPEPLVTGPSNDRQPAWSPDGESLVFTRVDLSSGAPGPSGLGGQIFVADKLGQTIQPLTSGDPAKFFPRWSPDGKEILFSVAPEPGVILGERDGRYQVYAMNADGSDVRKLTDEPSGAHFGTWC